MKTTRRVIIIGPIIIGVFILGALIYLFRQQEIALLLDKRITAPPIIRPIAQSQITPIVALHSPCLGDDETASYKINKKENEVSTADIIVSDKKTSQEKYRFQIEAPIPDHYHPIELHECGVYAARDFNYDYSRKRPIPPEALPNYRIELWRYDYNGEGRSLVFLSGPVSGSGFGTDFRIDSQEKYIVLEKSYLDKEDYSLIIKDMDTKQDVFTLLAKDIAKQYPNIIGVLDMLEWSEDSRYFWGGVSEGAYVNGYFRIDVSSWKVDIFEAPDGTMGGSKLNVKTGYLPIQPGAVWTGDLQLTQELQEQYRKEGKKSVLYLYNLFTKQKILITSTADDPLWWFRPQWLSDTELEYELPSGEKKVYKIKE